MSRIAYIIAASALLSACGTPAVWLGWERYHQLLEAKQQSAAVQDCGSRYCKDKEGAK
jgi:hypothetical protein